MPDPQSPPALDAWHAIELELVAFPETPQVDAQQDWWRALTGGEANSTRKRFARVDDGIIRGCGFALQIDPLRVHWKLTGAIDAENMAALTGPPTVGPFPEARDRFVEWMDRWLREMCPPLNRLAFAAKLMHPTERREDSYALLAKYLPRIPVDPNSFEFQYRINRRRPTTAPIQNLIINRLSIWSAITFGVEIEARMANSPGGKNVVKREFDGCLLQLDINTVQEFQGILPHEHLPELWSELVRLGTEIAERGDIP